ncbi:hypothetical protein CROQUDRAFT_657872 [Cronartium quercuum f. sp. fusiforme G11]|uniref:Amidohydrolase 3 domain-containing protein n=1 Tax=Cronartium quercuum f. sp. fusiforme G11 TaxID=708437 RepID=A0A9P6NL81_9BASI|nr:hypothetical protein CROQUDRAFT_657872 [Cronartium quercuum f. sp. fusiforme G11]
MGIALKNNCKSKDSASILTSREGPPESKRFKRSTFIRWSIAGVLVLICVVYQTRLKTFVLPERYVLCSPTRRIYTFENYDSSVECVVIERGLITYAGARHEVERIHGKLNSKGFGWNYLALVYRPNRLQLINLPDRWSVLPGLIDAHAHPLEYGQAKMGVDLLGCTSTQCIVDRITKHIRGRPDLIKDRHKTVLGDGWDQTLFETKEFPSAADLSTDPLLVGRPIALRRIDFHAYWVSQDIINRLNLSDPDMEVEGGEIIRDSLGRPTGIFLDAAMDLIDKIQPKRTDEDRLAFLHTTAKEMLSVGLTGVNDAAADLDTISFYRKLDKENKLPIRIWAMVNCWDKFCGDSVELYEGSRLTVRSVKLFLDGALGSWGAAMSSPYSDNPETRGILRMDPETILPLVRQWVTAGFQVNAHAIGDRANSIILDAYAQVLAEVDGISEPNLTSYISSNKLRLRIEHAQILKPSDIVRMGNLNVLASVQPTHAIADMDYAEDRLGPERIRGAYAWKSLQRNNVTLVLGSDFPVSPVSPFLGIHAAFSRKKPIITNDSNPSWYPNECISTIQEIINGFTKDVCYSNFVEHKLGSLISGKLADLIILDQDIMNDVNYNNLTRKEQEDMILNVRVKATILNGNLVFGNIEKKIDSLMKMF